MKFYFFLLSIISTSSVFSQEIKIKEDKDAAYTRTINQRADKIVATLGIPDPSRNERVKNIISNQYRNLNAIHTSRDLKIKSAKEKASGNKKGFDAQIKTVEDEANAGLEKLHKVYLSALSLDLTPGQVEQVKDGMTYGVVPITYNGYLAMLPDLTNKQKEQILFWLVEAREQAMDAESSEKKHGWFGKYKGKINNYLSAAGYDLKKAGQDWERRRNAEKAAKS